jgi:hypothetical protein
MPNTQNKTKSNPMVKLGPAQPFDKFGRTLMMFGSNVVPFNTATSKTHDN